MHHERSAFHRAVIFEYGSVQDLLDGEHTLELGDRLLHWRGLAYLPGVQAGAASLAACDWSSGIDGVCAAARALKGSYVLSVMERDGGGHYVFTDGGGHVQAFVCGATASTSFLGLCERARIRFADLDPSAVAEFLDLGHVYGERTLVPSVRPLPPGRVYELRAGAEPIEHDAAIPPIGAPAPEGLTIERFFRDLCLSLHGLRVSVDLTGGSDSRLVATLLSDAPDVEFAITGVPGNSDITIASRTAAVLGRPLHVLYHVVGDLDAEARELLEVSDGLCDMLAFHRLRQNAVARCARGVQVALGGIGGELYKDFWWLQDFPRYRSRRSNLERLFNLRFRPIALPAGMLAAEYADGATGVRDRILGEMRQLRMPLNTQTYDRIYYEMKMKTVATRTTSMSSRFLAFDTPLLDPELVRLAFALPRAERFLNRFHRRVLTAACPQVARLASTEGGMSLSARPSHEASDAVAYGIDKLRRLAGKAAQRILSRPLRLEQPDHPDLIPAARSSAAFGASIRRLRAGGVLAADVDEAVIPDRYVGRLMTLGLLAERLDQ